VLASVQLFPVLLRAKAHTLLLGTLPSIEALRKEYTSRSGASDEMKLLVHYYEKKLKKKRKVDG
jgi:hypothetical protein